VNNHSVIGKTDHREFGDFDSAIPRFESWYPSQPSRSIPGDFSHFAKKRHFRRLAARSPVSSEEFRASRTEGLKSRGVSLLAGLSISEICVRKPPETGCVCAETGSNPQRLELRQSLGRHRASFANRKEGPCPAQTADSAPHLTLSTGWPHRLGIGGRFRSEWVAAFRRNQWPLCLGFRMLGARSLRRLHHALDRGVAI
jgi:hypothetical protein